MICSCNKKLQLKSYKWWKWSIAQNNVVNVKKTSFLFKCKTQWMENVLMVVNV